MDKFLVELIVAIREIKEILHMHGEEIEKLKESVGKREPKNGSEVDERLMKMALEGSRSLYMRGTENRLEKKLGDMEKAVKELSEKLSVERDIEVSEDHLNRLRKALAE